MSDREIFTTYQALCKFNHFLMSNPNMIQGDLNAIQDIFIGNMNEVLKIAFTISVTDKEIQNLFTHYPTPTTLQKLDFMASKIENPKSYIIINYYLAIAAEAILKGVRREYKNDCHHKLNQLNLSPDAFDNIERTYRTLTQGISS